MFINQDSSGRIIRTVMDADQQMVPGQQVYYTQSEDGQVITSVMDSAPNTTTEETAAAGGQEAGTEAVQQQVDASAELQV